LKFYVFIKIIIALFLIYRFNPFRKYSIQCTELDKKMAYSAGLYILLFTFLDLVTYFVDDIRAFVKKVYSYFGINDKNLDSNNQNQNQ
jgi:hypothetical protein